MTFNSWERVVLSSVAMLCVTALAVTWLLAPSRYHTSTVQGSWGVRVIRVDRYSGTAEFMPIDSERWELAQKQK